MDKAKIEAAVRLFLEGIGEDPDREGLIGTPDRIARMCEEIYGGTDEEVAVHLSKTFTAAGNEIVLEKDITLYSTCEHHLLPFHGKAHVAYYTYIYWWAFPSWPAPWRPSPEGPRSRSSSPPRSPTP